MKGWASQGNVDSKSKKRGYAGEVSRQMTDFFSGLGLHKTYFSGKPKWQQAHAA
jgi:hypothetical protein